MTPSAGKHAHRVIVVGAALVALTLAAALPLVCAPAARAAGAQEPGSGQDVGAVQGPFDAD
jgi:hypothetical protein